MFGERALSLFIQPPSVEELRRRLISRATDPIEEIEKRVGKAEFELGFAKDYDAVVVNDDLARAIADTDRIIKDFIAR